MRRSIRPNGDANPTPIHIERIVRLPEGFDDLTADALADGQRMMQVLHEDWLTGTLRFDGWGEALFAAHIGQALVGVGGLTRDPYLPKDLVGRVRRLYVRRAARRAGVGRALVLAVARQAAESGYPRLRVRAPVAAFAFYESCGFLRAVGEPAATHALPLSAVPG